MLKMKKGREKDVDDSIKQFLTLIANPNIDSKQLRGYTSQCYAPMEKCNPAVLGPGIVTSS